MDTRAFLANRIFELLTGDAELSRLCGGDVRLYLEQADPGTKFPYSVQTLSESPELAGLMAESRLYLEWWVQGETKTRLANILARTRAVLDRRMISTADEPAGNARVFYEPVGAPLDGVTEHVWGESMEFSIRYCCTDILQAIATRDSGGEA